jgi:hypothetical protein
MHALADCLIHARNLITILHNTAKEPRATKELILGRELKSAVLPVLIFYRLLLSESRKRSQQRKTQAMSNAIAV